MRRQRLLRFALVMLFLAGCAPLAPKFVVEKGTDLKGNEALVGAFERYWAYRAEGNTVEAFKLEAPYVQEMVPPERYRNYLRLFSKAKMNKVLIYGISSQEPSYICLNSRGFYERKGKKEPRDFEDCWVEVNGRWYHVLKNPLFFPQLSDRGSWIFYGNPLTFSSTLT